MIGDQVADEGQAATPDPIRGKSKIEFPYLDYQLLAQKVQRTPTMKILSCRMVGVVMVVGVMSLTHSFLDW